MKRAGLDYHEFAHVSVHEKLSPSAWPRSPAAASSRSPPKGRTRPDQVSFKAGDVFLFGPETRGLPAEILDGLPQERKIRLPMKSGSRSMNLSNTVAVIVFEAWRQNGFSDGL